MICNYRISESAISDLEQIWLYTYRNWSKEQADKYRNLIIQEIEFIVEDFNLGRPMNHVRSGYNMSKVKSHLVFYRKTKSNVVEIVRILHQNMDIENRLKEK